MHPLLRYLRRYLWIDGRAGRREWWATMILVLMLGVQLDVSSIFARPLFNASVGVDGAIRMALSLLLFWIDLASTIRRVHDRGKAGWSALPFLFPGLGWMWMIVECGILPSQKGRNRFGPVPGSVEEERERPSLPDIFAAFGEDRTRNPWSQRAAEGKRKVAAMIDAAARQAAAQDKPAPDRQSVPALKSTPARARDGRPASRQTGRQPVLATSAVTRVADANQTRGKTILIVVAATILGLAVATYMADSIVVPQSGHLSTTP